MNNYSLSGMTRVSASLGVLLVILVGVSASAAGLGNTRQFAVKMNMVGDLGEMQGQEITMTIYVGKNRMRAEMGGPEMEAMPGGIAFISTFDGDEVTTYTLMSMMKQYTKNVGTSEDGAMHRPLQTIVGWPAQYCFSAITIPSSIRLYCAKFRASISLVCD